MIRFVFIIETSEYFSRLVWLSIAYIQVYANEAAIMLFSAPLNEGTNRILMLFLALRIQNQIDNTTINVPFASVLLQAFFFVFFLIILQFSGVGEGHTFSSCLDCNYFLLLYDKGKYLTC